MNRYQLWLWGPLAVYMAIIFGVSSSARIPEPPGFPGGDKLEHYLAYAVLGFLAFRAVSGAWKHLRGWRAAGIALAISSIYGATDELHQKFVPTRTCDVYDLAADTLGAATAIAIAVIVARMRTHQKKEE